MGHRSGVGDRHWEVPRATDGRCREKPWSRGQARTQERSLEKSWGVWASAQVLPPTCCVTLGKSLALSGLQFYLHVK